MCGVAAVLRWDGIGALAVAQAMMSRARHRGPDGHGSCVVARGPSHEVAFAHARLAILGLGEQGAQPFVRGPVTLTYNGEIYNYRELRQELRALGHRIDGTGDTEVLAAAWEAWGAGCLPRLDGMFAFVLWDARDGRLYAARDAFGIKPLHWARTQGGVAIASEIKQFRSVPGWSPVPDREVLGAFLALGLHDTDPVRTFFEGVQRLEAGCWMELDPSPVQDACMRITRFSDPSALPGWTIGDPYEARALVLDEFRRTVDEHLVAEVPVGSCASGGTDSSAIVIAARDSLGRGLDLFHAHTAVRGMDELHFVRALAERSGSALHVVPVTADAVQGAFDSVMEAQDEPFGDASVVAQWLLMRRAREEGVPVLLDGQGADELFMGYAKYQFHHFRDLGRDGQFWDLACHATHLLVSGEAVGPRSLARMRRYLPRRFRGAASLRLPAWAPTRDESWERWRSSSPRADTVARQDIAKWSLPLLLRYEDRNSMAHGIEARVPFACWRMARTARRISPALHVRGGRVKALLRDAVGPGLPATIRSRRTRFGFVTAWGEWARPGGALSDWIERSAIDSARRLGMSVSAADLRGALARPAGRELALRLMAAGTVTR